MLAERALAARLGNVASEAFDIASGREIEVDHHVTMFRDGVAQFSRHRVDQTAFDAVHRDDEFALTANLAAVRTAPGNDGRFDRLPRILVREEFAPTFGTAARDVETAVGRLQRREIDRSLFENPRPRSVRSEHRPAAAAKREDGRIGAHDMLAVVLCEAQFACVIPAEPALVHVEIHAARAQPPHPAAQQRRGFEIAREHAAGRSDERLHTESARPFTQGVGVEFAQPRAHLVLALVIMRHETLEGIGMRKIEAAFSGDQKFAPDRAHAFVHVHRHARGACRLRGHQPRRAAADDEDAAFIVGLFHRASPSRQILASLIRPAA